MEQSRRNGVEARAIPMDWLANILTHPTGRTVIDKTGLHGLYDVDMEWMPDAQGTPAINAAYASTIAFCLLRQSLATSHPQHARDSVTTEICTAKVIPL